MIDKLLSSLQINNKYIGMFGLYRLVLALIVAAHHLLAIPIIGPYAVYGFFILSGYLMTLIMVETYGHSLTGVFRFCLNRLLRLYPTHWCILFVSVIIITFMGEDNARNYRTFMYLPRDLSQWLQNIFLVFCSQFPGSVVPRVSPPSWALTVELFYYCLIALGLSRSRLMTTIWFCCSILYIPATYALGLGPEYRLASIFSFTLAFSSGAMIFHYKSKLEKYINLNNSKTVIISSIILLGINAAASAKLGGNDTSINAILFLHVNYLLNAILITALIHIASNSKFRTYDKRLGDLSYPLYLMHWQMGFLASMLLWGKPLTGMSAAGISSFLATIILSVALSWLIIRKIEVPIERLRRQLKAARAPASNNDRSSAEIHSP